MRSPFPGMDPYLEAHWGDIHSRLIIYASEQLQPSLPEDLRARVEERIFVDAEHEGSRHVVPDVRVYERAKPTPVTSGNATTDINADIGDEPLILTLEDEPVTETFIEIREKGTGGLVITVIEIVSPANKRKGEGRRTYLEKQKDLRRGSVNSVEIDLLRGGKYVVGAPEGAMPPEYRQPFRISVWRAARPTNYEVYRTSLREPLPSIRIPLREEDQDIRLDLQPLVDRAYETGAYDDIDYTEDPRPPLKRKDAVWADALLREKGKRD